ESTPGPVGRELARDDPQRSKRGLDGAAPAPHRERDGRPLGWWQPGEAARSLVSVTLFAASRGREGVNGRSTSTPLRPQDALGGDVDRDGRPADFSYSARSFSRNSTSAVTRLRR